MKLLTGSDVIALAICLLPLGAFAQTFDSGDTSGANSARLKTLESQFRQLQAANKNSQALEVLQRYTQLYVSKLQEQQEKEVQAMESAFAKSSKDRKDELRKIRLQSESLEATISELESSRARLYSSTVVFFIALGSFIAVVLVYRKRKLRATQLSLDSASKVKDHLSQVLQVSGADAHARIKVITGIAGINRQLSELSEKLSRISEDKNHPDSRLVRHLLSDLKQADRISAVDFNETEPDEKAVINLNELISDVVVLVQEDFRRSNPDFEYELSLDLESILPPTEVYPSSLREALFCLISNAVWSVFNRKGSAPKGYQPKVSVSTRKLPRFIQIRIRHNGEPAALPESKAGNHPAYSDNLGENRSRMGMLVARQSVTVVHKAELVFETEPGSQYDTIIRFQTLVLQ